MRAGTEIRLRAVKEICSTDVDASRCGTPEDEGRMEPGWVCLTLSQDCYAGSNLLRTIFQESIWTNIHWLLSFLRFNQYPINP